MRWLLLFFALMVGVVQSKEPPQPNKANKQTATEQRGSEQSPLFVKTSSPTTDAERDHEAYEKDQKPWNETAIAYATIALAFITLALAIFTAFLWKATRRLVIAAGNTAKWQLRAYVGVYQISVADFESGQPSTIQIHATNYGKTPAHKTAITGAIDIFPWPLPEAHELPEIPSPGAASVLFPTAQLDFPARPTREFTPAELDAACEGKTKRFYCFGVVTYIDAFTEPRETHFCVSLSGGENLIKLRKGGKPDGLRFEIAHQHNRAT